MTYDICVVGFDASRAHCLSSSFLLLSIRKKIFWQISIGVLGFEESLTEALPWRRRRRRLKGCACVGRMIACAQTMDQIRWQYFNNGWDTFGICILIYYTLSIIYVRVIAIPAFSDAGFYAKCPLLAWNRATVNPVWHSYVCRSACMFVTSHVRAKAHLFQADCKKN